MAQSVLEAIKKLNNWGYVMSDKTKDALIKQGVAKGEFLISTMKKNPTK